MQTSALDSAGGQGQLLRQLMELARANAVQEDTSDGASSAQSAQDAQGGQPASPPAPPVAGTTPADMFSGSTLGALTSVQEGASNIRQAVDADVANQMVSQLDSNGDGQLSLSEIENALGVSGGTASGPDASGATSSSDAASGLSAAFAQVDTNGDGELSADELTSTLNQMTGPGQVAGHHGHHGHHHHGGGDIDALLGGGDGSTTASGSNSTTAGDGSAGAGATSTASNSTSTNTVSTLDGLSTADVAQALQAFLNSLAQSQAANLSAVAQSSSPTSVTA